MNNGLIGIIALIVTRAREPSDNEELRDEWKILARL